MTRLYDRLNIEQEPTLRQLFDKNLREQIGAVGPNSCVVFDITNVAHYWYDHQRDYGDIGDFPNVAPPFGLYWMEWRNRPNKALPIDRVGALVLACDAAKEPTITDENIRWIVGIVAMHAGRGGKPRALASWRLHISGDGVITIQDEEVSNDAIELWGDAPLPDGHANDLVEMAQLLGSLDDDELRERRAEVKAKLAELQAQKDALDEDLKRATAPVMRLCLLHPVLMAHSFMACKNVEQEGHQPPEKLSRKYRRKKGHGLTKFYTLVIKPTGGGHATERLTLGDGFTALHIVRGHFKTYTADRPLLGRHVGTYWWSPTARGKEEHGEIVKQYDVQP